MSQQFAAWYQDKKLEKKYRNASNNTTQQKLISVCETLPYSSTSKANLNLRNQSSKDSSVVYTPKAKLRSFPYMSP